MKKQRTGHKSTLSTEAPDSMASLAGKLSDDFNNILTVVLGASSLIDSNSSADTELLRCVSLIRASAEHAVGLSSQLALACSVQMDRHKKHLA